MPLYRMFEPGFIEETQAPVTPSQILPKPEPCMRGAEI